MEEVLGIFLPVKEMSPLNLTVAAVTPVETPEAPGLCVSVVCWIADGILKLCAVLLRNFQRMLVYSVPSGGRLIVIKMTI